jgi:carboxypeptidase Taq
VKQQPGGALRQPRPGRYSPAVADALERLKVRTAQIVDLDRIGRILSWDQQTMMPAAGAEARADHLATLRRLQHELLAGAETERLLDELAPLADSLPYESDDAALIRLVRREYDKAIRVPADLRGEMRHASAIGLSAWGPAKEKSDYAALLPHLEKNLELRHKYVECFERGDETYDVLLDDYEPLMKTAEVRAIFDELKPELGALIAEFRDDDADDSFLTGDFPVERQVALAHDVVQLFGMRPQTWRLDPTEHPFASGAGVDDVRLTTHYDPRTMKSFFSTMHEYGHGLYSHQAPRHLMRLPTGLACSLGIHESQSRLWENLVGRSLPFWRFYYTRVQDAFPEQLGHVELPEFYAAINRVRPSLIRIKADEVTYGMHVILRFELEQDVINGRVGVRELPGAWNAKMNEYLGVDVPDDARGVLQDTHWASGSIGYFATYLLGTVMSVQIWQRLAADIPTLDEQIERGEFGSLREWLAEHVHAHGRKFSPQETLERATGSTIDARPYLGYLRSKHRAGVAA